jgi:GDP-4-dehydro-6-deoxy-D-mannose reductase
MRALVVGADGFAGRWLTRHLLESGDSVDALVGPRFVPPLPGAAHVEQTDVRDLAGLTRFLASAQPEAIYYLAGVSHQGGRDVLPAAVGVSVTGCMNTLIAASSLAAPPRFLFVSTGLVYREADHPLREDDPTSPNGLYAIAKLVGEESLGRLGPPSGVEVVIARPFNHIGPGQREPFIVPNVASQIADVVGRRSETITIRSASPVRDYSDVRDVVRGYRLLVARADPGSIHNIASGSGISVGRLIETMLEIVGASARVEPSGIDDEGPQTVIGDASRIKRLGWEPEYSLRRTLEDALYERLRQPGSAV